MYYYAMINQSRVIGKIAQVEQLDRDDTVEITGGQYSLIVEKGNNYYIYENGKIKVNPNYEQEQAEKEQDRINKLTMTALDFIGVLEHFGLDYATQIKPFLELHQDLDKQLKYCQNVWCGVAKQIFAEPITIDDITITSEMVEQAFKNKYGITD